MRQKHCLTWNKARNTQIWNMARNTKNLKNEKYALWDKDMPRKLTNKENEKVTL
jgi:hypothetical protein